MLDEEGASLMTPTVFRSFRKSSARSSGGGMAARGASPAPAGCFTSSSKSGRRFGSMSTVRVRPVFV